MSRRWVRRVLALSAVLALAALAGPGSGAAGATSIPTVAGAWHVAPSVPSAVTPLTAVAGRDGRLYLFGACLDRCAQLNGTVGQEATATEIYDPATRHWRPGVHPPAACGGLNGLSPLASALDASGHIELAGCWGVNAATTTSTTGPRVAIFHAATQTWTLEDGHAPWATPMAGMPGQGGRVLWFSAALRKSGSAVFTNGYRVLIDNHGTWTSGASMGGHAPSDAAVVGLDGRVYVLGADRDCRAEFARCTAAPIRAYNPATNAWQTVGPLPVSRSQLAAVVDRHGRIFVLGGLTPDATALVRAVDVYDPATKQWARAGSLPSERFEALAAATSDGRVWVLGGYAPNGNPLASMDVFVPIS